ncbi:tetratricopeptide repeat protein [Polyangium jinanense]|nr:tetratricopeptide repeat protein [Polyangium jinanense]
MRVARNLTWIHLSDLHFGHGKEATTRFDQKLVADAIIHDAVTVAGELGPPDVVFVTGDIAFSASADKEYPTAKEWLDKLLAALKLGPERVLLVPGNHDVDRKKAQEGPSRLVHKGLRSNPDEVNGLLEKADEMEVVWPKLAAYQNFAKAFGAPEITPAIPFWTKQLSSDLGPVEAIGLNTALLSFDNGDSRENLALGLGQLLRALEGVKSDALLFVLQHHPPGWLRDGKDLLALLKGRPHLLLYGHVHDQHGFVTLPLDSRANLELVAGAGHQDAKEEGNHAYAWGRLNRDGLEYYPRAWLKRELKLWAQQILPPEDQKGYSLKLGEFVRFPRAKLPDALDRWLANSTAHAPSASTADSITGPAAFSGAIAEPAPAPAAPVVATFDPANAYVSIPFRAKGDQVVGRADALKKVREQLVKGRRTAIGQTAAFVGLGGLGKTQLAVEYAHTYKDQYPGGVYWFNADADLHAQLTRLAWAARWVSPAAEPRVVLEIATHQIRNRSNCLIVFDNVENLAAIEFLLPEGSATPHLLITSRVSQVGFDPVPIDPLTEVESLEMLRRESGRSLDKPSDHEAALRIVKQLEGLPLALELAGAYLRRAHGVSWMSYADLLESEGVKARGLRDGPLSSFTKHNADLYATLRIHKSILDDSPLLGEALDLLAWSGATSMGRELLGYLLGRESAALDVALGEAETLRILKQEQGSVDPSNARFQMHRLVREVRQAEVPLAREPARWLGVLERLGNWFQDRRDNFAHLSFYEAELDHLEVWQKHAARMGYMRDAVRLLWLRAYPPYYRGQYRQAHDTVKSALALFEGSAVIDPKLEAYLRNDWGRTLNELGDHRKALEYHQQALDIRRDVLGETHPDTAESLNNVGHSLGETGNHRTALEYQKKALEIYRKVLGETHPNTATSLSNIGGWLGKCGEHEEALEYQLRALDIHREVHGEAHPDTALSLNNVGGSFGELREYQNAIDYHQKGLSIQLQVLGENHPDTATSLLNVGMTLQKLGNPVQALKHLKMGLSIRQETLGDRHPDTQHSWENVVRLLLRQRKKADALALVENDLKKFPHNPTLKRLKQEILGRRSAKVHGKTPGPTKKAKSPKR